ncbi:hypothetical protein CPB85DRAFT_1436913 [Mucidula mucida]|nr:hypothetical protein CPB85DRAFT_1436913 [Mucidula mucida]
MPPSIRSLDLSQVTENALRSSADFARFTTAIHDAVPAVPTTLSTAPRDLDTQIKRACAVLRAMHHFQTNDRNRWLGLTLRSTSTSFMARILPRLAMWMTYFMENIIRPGLASLYDEDLHRICVQCLLDAVQDIRQPDLLKSLVSVANPTQNAVKFPATIIPDLLLHHSASISRPGSVDTLIKICDIAYRMLYFNGLPAADSTRKEDLLIKLTDTPGPTPFSLNSVLQDALFRLRSSPEQELPAGFARPNHCCAFLKPEWIENPSALYLPNLHSPD